MTDIHSLVADLIDQIGIGKDSLMLPTAYDTAWVAQVPSEGDSAVPAFPEALQWLRDNQLPDGSWGAKRIEYVHDRIICTLAALIALIERGGEESQTQRVERGMRYTAARAPFLAQEIETIGFELIVPTLLDRMARLGLSLSQENFARYGPMRADKLSRVPRDMMYRKDVTFAFSLEFMGDELDPEQVQQEANGSVGVSPSATAYFLTHTNNAAARRYIADVIRTHDGQAPNMAPIDIFETTWALWNLQLAGVDLRSVASDHLADLQMLHHQRGAVGSSSYGSFVDADGTAILLSVLKNVGAEIHPDVLAPFFRQSHFACFPWERNPSVSANVHVLDALKGIDEKAEEIIVDYLAQQQNAQGFWEDKWHSSPYYTTGHAVIALSGLDGRAAELTRSAAGWLLKTWHADGSWGHYGPTAEETAYVLQALVMAARQGLCPANLTRPAIRDGLAYLERNLDDPYPPPLWIGKCLYAPVRVVQAAILSAYLMSRDYLEGDPT